MSNEYYFVDIYGWKWAVFHQKSDGSIVLVKQTFYRKEDAEELAEDLNENLLDKDSEE